MVSRKPKGLGKGLDNFFGVKSVADVLDTSEGELVPSTLPIGALQPGKYQPRIKFEQDSLTELADSIKANGILNPIVVRRVESDKFEILAGERRYQAALQAGLKKVPVRIFSVNDKQALIIGLVENLQREDLNVMEVAEGLERLIKEFSYSHEEAAVAIGRSRSAISNTLRLLTLPKQIQSLVREGVLDMGHARPLLGLSEIDQEKIAKLVVEKKLSVRQTEELVRELKDAEKTANVKAKSKTSIGTKEFLGYEKELTKLFNTKVTVRGHGEGKGKVTISFQNKDELEALMSILRG